MDAIRYLDRLGEPFDLLDERLVVVSPAKIQGFTSAVPKVVFVLEGTALHRFGQGGVRPVRAGEVMINLRSARQTYLPVSPTRVSRLRALRLTFLPETKGVAPESFRRQILARLPRTGIFSGPSNWVAEMRRELQHPRPDSRQRVNALARGALIDLARALEDEAGTPADGRGHERLGDAICHYLEQHLARPLTLGDIARAVDRSPEHIARVFRQWRGHTIFAELQRLRIDRARFLLQCSNLSVAGISRECGFLTPAHFSRSFRQHTGQTPTEFVARAAVDRSSPRWV